MDIHRCRFVDFEPSAINALAFTHNSGRSGRNQPLRLAVGRANGDIEIWNPLQGSWLHETTFRGGKERSVEGLAWIQDPDEKNESTGFITNGKLRLFSIGYSSTVTEWDLITGLPLRHSSGSHSQVWCLAAQPRSRLGGKDTSTLGLSQDLVVGCADGSLVRLATQDDTLAFHKFIARASNKNARALSLAFQTRDTLVAGFADSSIRVYNVDNGNLLRTMTLGASPKGGPKEKLVWALECLKDGTIVSGDSSGEIRIWNGKNYSQQQRIEAHEADILCLASSDDGKTIMSGGIDRKTIIYGLSAANAQKQRWAKIAHSRYHKHDIKAMASFENSKMSLVVSGGLDTTPMLTPLREHGKEHNRALPHTPQQPPITGCGRYILNWNDNVLSIWHIHKRNQLMLIPGDFETASNYKVVARIALKGDENITSATITSRGSLLAIGTSAETKLFQLKPRSNMSFKVSKLQVPEVLSNNGSKTVQFSPNGEWLLCINMLDQVMMFKVLWGTRKEDAPKLSSPPTTLRRLRRPEPTQNSMNGEWGHYDRKILRAAFSSDSRILALSDLAGYIDTFILKGSEDPTSPAVNGVRTQRSSSPTSTDQSDSDSLSDSTSSSSSSEDEDDVPRRTRNVTNHGQHWTQNPAGKSIPRASSTPIVMSFQPLTDYSSNQSKLAGNASTRVNGHSHSPTADRLLVVTTKHDVFELEIEKGGFSDWSRRNPASQLPESFKLQRDRAMGCIWDVSKHAPTGSEHRKRVWLYGAAWLCMLDLSQDLKTQDPDTMDIAPARQETDDNKMNGVSTEVADENSSRKRKRASPKDKAATVSENLSLKKNTTGAGSKIPDHELGGGIGSRTILKIDEEGSASYVDIDAASAARQAMRLSDDEESDNEETLEEDLQRLRGRNHLNGTHDINDEAHSLKDKSARVPAFYLTNKYRPILGIVPLSSMTVSLDAEDSANDEETISDDNEPRLPEVALIERPFWDLELPPRFVSARDSRQ